MRALLVWICLGVLSSINAEKRPWIVKEEFLSQDIASFDCHSSSIVETDPGLLCTVWKGGRGPGLSNLDMKNNVGVWLSLFDGISWSESKEIVSARDSVCWNPVLCKYFDELLLFYRIGKDPRSVVSFLKRSQDGGMTWSKEEILPAGIVGPTKNKPIVTSDGVILCPSSVEVGHSDDQYHATACWIEISEDGGCHWKKVGPLEIPDRKFGVIEPALFYDKAGHIRMLCRDRAKRIGETGYLWESVSQDGGWSWSELKPTRLPNPDSGIDIVDMGGGKNLLFYNHSHFNRYPLHLCISLNGMSWSSPLIIDDTGEFPAAVLASDGKVHLTYAIASPVQRRIKHVVIDPEMLPSFRK